MARIEIEWVSDWNDCEQCGGNYANGALVRIDGAEPEGLDLAPVSACYDGTHYDREEVYRRILAHLGNEVAEV